MEKSDHDFFFSEGSRIRRAVQGRVGAGGGSGRGRMRMRRG